MGIGTKLNSRLCAFIERQPVYFVATAAPDGRVNVSPKGMNTLLILSDTHIRWLNLSGSGNETTAHLRALNGLMGSKLQIWPRNRTWGGQMGA